MWPQTCQAFFVLVRASGKRIISAYGTQRALATNKFPEKIVVWELCLGLDDGSRCRDMSSSIACILAVVSVLLQCRMGSPNRMRGLRDVMAMHREGLLDAEEFKTAKRALVGLCAVRWAHHIVVEYHAGRLRGFDV